MSSTEPVHWPRLLQQPAAGDHFVQVYQDEPFLCDAVAAYAGTGLRRGEGLILIATPAHRAAFMQRLGADGLAPGRAVERGRLVLLDAEETLARFTPGGMPDWQTFHTLIGGAIAGLRLVYPGVRAYGEMVDVLWQRGERDAALRLEEFWNDLTRLQTFSLLCTYCLDHLDAASYSGPLECVCKVHTHLIPTPDYGAFDQAVIEASCEILDPSLAGMVLSLSANSKRDTAMPEGQATLLWLKRNMPRTADKILAAVKARLANRGQSPILFTPPSSA